jgi:hypothetical protein
VSFEEFFAPGTWYVWVDGAVDGALGDFVLRVEPR